MSMDKKEFMEKSKKLINDNNYRSNITPNIDNSASKSSKESWSKEITWSTKNYTTSEYITF